MERETTTIETGSGVKVVMYSYATGREARQIEAKYLGSVKVGLDKGEPTFKDFDTNAPFEAEKEMLSLLVVSVNGDTNNCVDKLLDMRADEYEFVVTKCNEITKKKI